MSYQNYYKTILLFQIVGLFIRTLLRLSLYCEQSHSHPYLLAIIGCPLFLSVIIRSIYSINHSSKFSICQELQKVSQSFKLTFLNLGEWLKIFFVLLPRLFWPKVYEYSHINLPFLVKI